MLKFFTKMRDCYLHAKVHTIKYNAIEVKEGMQMLCRRGKPDIGLLEAKIARQVVTSVVGA